MAGWFGGGMWIWTLIGVVAIILLDVMINRTSRNSQAFGTAEK